MKYIVVDLEMNPVSKKSEARKICAYEVIEIGAVMLDEAFHEIAAFRTYVKPQFNSEIDSKISKLTGITNTMVSNAPYFTEAFRMFTSWCLGTEDDVTIHAWSDSDYNQIFKEIILKDYDISHAESRILDTEWSDFQKEFDYHMGFEHQLSLKLALEMAGIVFEGHAHDALDDARNTAELFKVFNDEELFSKTLKKIEETMKPTPLGNTLGNMFDMSMFNVA